MNMTLNRIVGASVVVLGMTGCGLMTSVTEEASPNVLAYTIPTSDAPLTIDPQFNVGGFTLKQSPCDPAIEVVGDTNSGFYYHAAWDPYECVDDPSAVSNTEGGIIVNVDGLFMGYYTDASAQIDLSPKLTFTVYDVATNDIDGNGVADDYYAVCNAYMPGDNLGYMEDTVNAASAALGGDITVWDADSMTAEPYDTMDYQVWYYYASPVGLPVFFDYADALGQGHWVNGYLVNDVYTSIYGTAGPKSLFTNFNTSELADYTGRGIPWCGDLLGTSNPNFF